MNNPRPEKISFHYVQHFAIRSRPVSVIINMGQYWEFVNIDKRLSSGHLGKLGEFFASRTSDELMYLLAIPAVPLKNPSTLRGVDVAGSWAGDRIICLGDYADSWPDGVVSDGDFSQAASGVTSESEDATDRSPQTFTESCRTIRTVDYGYEKHVSYPTDRVWALRNISKELYVRSDGVPTINGGENFTYEDHDGLEGFPNLGHVLLKNILWSDDESTAMYFSDVRGAWAGDRIDIRLMDDVAEEMQEGGWVDISRREVTILYDIFLEDRAVRGDLPEELQTSFE